MFSTAFCSRIGTHRHLLPDKVRWLAGFAVEEATSVADVRDASDAFATMLQRPEDALSTLRRLAC